MKIEFHESVGSEAMIKAAIAKQNAIDTPELKAVNA